MRCCGIREIHALSYYATANEALKAFGALTYQNMVRVPPGKLMLKPDKGFRYIIFTQAQKTSSYGQRFADLIIRHKLGTLLDTGFHINPNSLNNLKVWIWEVDHEACTKFFQELADKKEAE